MRGEAIRSTISNQGERNEQLYLISQFITESNMLRFSNHGQIIIGKISRVLFFGGGFAVF